jgi:uncharacterized protein with HEPN domain
MNDRERVRLQHMPDAASEALSFLQGRTSEDLRRNRMFMLAVVKEIEIIGEAANQISDESRKTLPRIPWPKIVAMRNRVIHAYADVDLSIARDKLTIAPARTGA